MRKPLAAQDCSSKSSKKLDPFPVILHRILSDARFQDIITWRPHGCSWKLINKRRFINEVIPKYFNHAKFKSFLRQVNGWGFIRITKGTDKGSYYHKLFLRGKSQLAQKINRPKSFRAIYDNADNPPNFETHMNVEDVPQPIFEIQGLKPTPDINSLSPYSGSRSIDPQTSQVNYALKTTNAAQAADLSHSLSPNMMLYNLIEQRQKQIVALICLEEDKKMFQSPRRILSNVFQQVAVMNLLSLKQNTPVENVIFS